MFFLFNKNLKVYSIGLTFFLIQINSAVKAQTFYYSKASGDLHQLIPWGTNADGTGTQPPNFTMASRVYVITNTSLATIGAAWTVSGAGSKVQLGDGISA